MNLAILGERVVVDAVTKTVAAAVDEKKKQTWSGTLESIFESKLCSPDYAAVCACGFACAVASGKIGRPSSNPSMRKPMLQCQDSRYLRRVIMLRSGGSSFSRLLLLSNYLWNGAREKQFGLGPMLVEMEVVRLQWYFTW